MIKPHGSSRLRPLLVEDEKRREALLQEAETLPSLVLNSAAAANVVMLGGGYFTPLDGFMDLENILSTAENMVTTDELFWPVPVANLTTTPEAIEGADRIALRDPNVDGHPVIAVMTVDDIEYIGDDLFDAITQNVFGTLDESHPGVAVFRSLGRYCVSGPVEVVNLSYFETDFPGTFRTAVQIRQEIRDMGWDKVVAFQTRNPMHLAHEELCRMAMERLDADGLIIHMLLGKLKEGDIPASVRDACIRTMVDRYFPSGSVLVNGYGFDMLYAGPREALLHAVFRQNMGASHLIVGRDHAGVGSYYGPFDAQAIFDELPDNALEIEIFRADHTAWSTKLNRVVMLSEAPDHQAGDFIMLSGTRVRELLSQGTPPPAEFSRPEVAQLLIDHYRSAPAA